MVSGKYGLSNGSVGHDNAKSDIFGGWTALDLTSIRRIAPDNNSTSSIRASRGFQSIA